MLTVAPIGNTKEEVRALTPSSSWTHFIVTGNVATELEVEKEDWVIIDPKDNDIRETATSNLIFFSGNELLIPEKFILQGVVLRQLLPLLQQNFPVTRGAPRDTDLSTFTEILLCGSGRGVAPLNALSELGWNSSGNENFNQVRQLYDSLIEQACA